MKRTVLALLTMAALCGGAAHAQAISTRFQKNAIFACGNSEEFLSASAEEKREQRRSGLWASINPSGVAKEDEDFLARREEFKKCVVEKTRSSMMEWFSKTAGDDLAESLDSYACNEMHGPSDTGEYKHQVTIDGELIYPREQCFSDIGALVSEHNKKVEEKELAKKALKAQQEESRLAAEKEVEAKRAAAIKAEGEREAVRVANLRSGRVKPNNFKEVTVAHGSANAIDLASAPKIKPDGKIYHMKGVIEQDLGGNEFFAHATAGYAEDYVLQNLSGIDLSTKYFSVIVPKHLLNIYSDAKIGGRIGFVGRYVANMKYTTIAGQNKSAPVFQAVYLTLTPD